MNPWYMGIDIGTGSCKCVVIDDLAHPLGFGAADYGEPENSRKKWNEQNPTAILNALFAAAQNAIRSAQVSPSACRAICVGSALHSLLALDADGYPLTGVITWADLRSIPQAQAIREQPLAKQLYMQTGCPAHSMYPLYKILWLRQERPEVFAQAARFVSVKEYALEHLTGQWRVDFNVAAGSGLLNAHNLEWNPDSLALAGISADQLSPVCDPLETIPGLLPGAAERLGLPPNTPVVVGSSDAVNSSLGAGATQMDRQATCMIGTSGALRRMSGKPILDKDARTWCYAIDTKHYLVGGSINNGGLALSWLKDVFNQAINLSGDGKDLSFETLLDLAKEVPPGADGVLCLPFFAGERSPNWNMNAKAVFYGLTLEHNARHLARAVVEGVAFRLRSIYDVLQSQGTPIEEIRASGGFTNSPLWIQTVASALGHELITPAWGETSCLGAALWALYGSGVIHSIEEMGQFVQVQAVIRSDPAAEQCYQKQYRLYQDLYDALHGLFQ
jgi:gluconokinase